MPMYVRFKVPKELEDLAYELVEKTREKGKISKGANETTKQVERSLAKLVVMAEDVSPEEILAHMPLLCEEKNIPYTYVSSKQELGAAAGLKVPTAAVAILSLGDVKEDLDNLLKKLEDVKKQHG